MFRITLEIFISFSPPLLSLQLGLENYTQNTNLEIGLNDGAACSHPPSCCSRLRKYQNLPLMPTIPSSQMHKKMMKKRIKTSDNNCTVFTVLANCYSEKVSKLARVSLETCFSSIFPLHQQ